MISLVEHPALDWIGRANYLAAKDEERQIELYGMDLIWLLAKRYYPSIQQPSDVSENRKAADTRSARQIIKDTMKKLGGG